MNCIQFQPGLSVLEFIQQFRTEAQCKAALFQARWPLAFVVLSAIMTNSVFRETKNGKTFNLTPVITKPRYCRGGLPGKTLA